MDPMASVLPTTRQRPRRIVPIRLSVKTKEYRTATLRLRSTGDTMHDTLPRLSAASAVLLSSAPN